MNPNILTAVVALIVVSVTILLNERYRLFATDHFPTTTHRLFAYGWLATLILLVSTLVSGASRAVLTERDIDRLSFASLFTFHLILVVFLVGWWLLVGRPPVRRFLNLGPLDARSILLGVAVGVGGWAATLAIAMLAGLLLAALELVPHDMKPSPMIPWMAALPLWQKAVVVLSAMTVEEAFFRGWLQKRTGLAVSTVIFALAHAGYGQPLMLIGVTVVSIIIGITFYKTRQLVPCIVAHGVFDAIQLFVIVPLVLEML